MVNEEDYCYSIGLVCYSVIPNMSNQSLTTLSLPPSLLSHVQQVVLLTTWSIVRKHLDNEDHLI